MVSAPWYGSLEYAKSDLKNPRIYFAHSRSLQNMDDVVTVQPSSSKEVCIKSNLIENSLSQYFGHVSVLKVKQSVEVFETSTKLFSCGWCWVETENEYSIINLETEETLLVANEVNLAHVKIIHNI